MAGSNEFGEFLRARRGRLQPGDVGLPGGVGGRRRPGLRREELAALAGVSVDYYARLEQGKERNPSVAVVEAIADALQLDADARDHLRVLTAIAAGRPTGRAHARSDIVGSDVEHLIARLRPWPALVLTRTSDVLAANLEGLALLPGLAAWPAGQRNTVRYVFTHAAARSLFRHPQIGTVRLSHTTLQLADDSTRISVYQATPGSTDEDALHLLALDPANGARP